MSRGEPGAPLVTLAVGGCEGLAGEGRDGGRVAAWGDATVTLMITKMKTEVIRVRIQNSVFHLISVCICNTLRFLY